jgi:cytochrome c oxidase cbb3-type subunit II
MMNGYNARPEYGAMAGIGTNMEFTEFDVTAIMNYERTSWGNNAKTVTPEEIKKIMDFIKIKVATPK